MWTPTLRPSDHSMVVIRDAFLKNVRTRPSGGFPRRYFHAVDIPVFQAQTSLVGLFFTEALDARPVHGFTVVLLEGGHRDGAALQDIGKLFGDFPGNVVGRLVLVVDTDLDRPLAVRRRSGGGRGGIGGFRFA